MQPFRCPVCYGRGMVDAGFYTGSLNNTSTAPETCRTCKGTGIIWGSEKEELEREISERPSNQYGWRD